MMKKLKIFINYFVWIPFAVSIGAFVLYFRYFFTIKMSPTAAITNAVNLVMDRYLKIGLFSLLIGLLFVFINRISKIIFNEDKYYHEKYPWTNSEEENTKKDSEIKKSNNEILEEMKKDDKVKEEKEEIPKQEEVKKDYIINKNPETNDKISNDIKRNRVLKARFIDNQEEKMIEILSDDDETEVLSVVMPEVKKQTVIKVDSSKVKIDGFKHCKKCNNLVVEDAVICVHCGVLLDESLKLSVNKNGAVEETPIIKKKKKGFNGPKFAINAIIIIICFIGIILLCHKIESQKTQNDKNLNQTESKIESLLK